LSGWPAAPTPDRPVLAHPSAIVVDATVRQDERAPPLPGDSCWIPVPPGRPSPRSRGRPLQVMPRPVATWSAVRDASGVPSISRRVGYLAPAGEAWVPQDCLR
jgi:hypothetical protein